MKVFFFSSPPNKGIILPINFIYFKYSEISLSRVFGLDLDFWNLVKIEFLYLPDDIDDDDDVESGGIDSWFNFNSFILSCNNAIVSVQIWAGILLRLKLRMSWLEPSHSLARLGSKKKIMARARVSRAIKISAQAKVSWAEPWKSWLEPS
jgi:hypothetical protein